MPLSKKVVLFIVEGITDEESFELILNRLNTDNKNIFKTVNGDITTNRHNNVTNIIEKIYEQVKKSMNMYHYKKTDISQIIHLVDTDGAFVTENRVTYKDCKTAEYTCERIYTNNVNEIIDRNVKKSLILNKLSTLREICNIPYSVYFLSCNLEHVLHNVQNVSPEEKMQYAICFSEKYADNVEEFVKFMNNEDFAVTGGYDETWNFIKQNNNSLKRHCNFHLFINKLVNK